MSLILGAQSATAAGFSIDNSVWFNGTSQGLIRTSPSDTPTSSYKFTASFWAKRANVDSSGFFTYTHGASTPYESIYWQTNGNFFFGLTKMAVNLQNLYQAQSIGTFQPGTIL